MSLINAQFSLVVGGDLTWNDGQLYPDVIRPEYGVVGGQLTVSDSSLLNRFESNLTVTSTLQADFDSTQSYFVSIQDNLASETTNVISNFQWGGIFLTCNETTSDRYVASIDSDLISGNLLFSFFELYK